MLVLLLILRDRLRADSLLLLPELGSEFGAEILSLEHLADLDFRLCAWKWIGTPLDPVDRFFLMISPEKSRIRRLDL